MTVMADFLPIKPSYRVPGLDYKGSPGAWRGKNNQQDRLGGISLSRTEGNRITGCSFAESLGGIEIDMR